MARLGALAALLVALAACQGVHAAKHKFKEGDPVTLWANKGAPPAPRWVAGRGEWA